MHKNSIVYGATDAHKISGGGFAEAKSSAYIGAVTRSRQSQGSGRRWLGALAMVTVAAVLVLAGCADGGGDGADTTAPTLSNVQVIVTATAATVTATVNESTTLFWAVYSDNTVPADAAALIADAGKEKTAPIVANSGAAGQTVSTAGSVSIAISGLTEGTSYGLYAVARDVTGSPNVLSAKIAIRTTDTTAPAGVTNITATGIGNTGVRLVWTNPDPMTDDLKQIALQWTTVSDLDSVIGSQTVSNLTKGGDSSRTVSGLTVGTVYRFSFVAVDTSNNRSQTATVDGGPLIDRDGDTLIDISNLDMLNNVRYGLAGTFYANTTAATSGLQCGTTGTIACAGYELTRNLDFATAGDYTSGTVNNAWRPNASTPASATNGGWVPIGKIFTGIFDGKGHTISNLYVRGSASGGNYGLFDQLSGTVRNLGVVNGAVYGSLRVGIVAGQTNSGSTIIASYASGTANGGAGAVGGLVGVHSGIIIASYTSGNADGGGRGGNRVGGLVGSNSGGIIIASYASGNADGGVGGGDAVGGLVGVNGVGGSTITASYASGTADGGAGSSDRPGSLVSINSGSTITASYGFGMTTGGEFTGSAGSTKPTAAADSGIAGARKLNAPGTTTPVNTAVPAAWNAATSNTLGAWDFGTAMQAPALKYADYDGPAGTVYNCNQFPVGACGTLIPGQTGLR